MSKLDSILNFEVRLALIWAAIYTTWVYLVVPLRAILYLPAEAFLWTTCIFIVLICAIVFTYKYIESIFAVVTCVPIFVAMWFSVNEGLIINSEVWLFGFLHAYGWLFSYWCSFQALIVLFLIAYGSKNPDAKERLTPHLLISKINSQSKEDTGILGGLLLEFTGGFFLV